MGLIQTFLNAFNKGREDAEKKARADALEHARSDGGTLGSTPQGMPGRSTRLSGQHRNPKAATVSMPITCP